MTKSSEAENRRLGWILVHSVNRYEGENRTPIEELKEYFRPNRLWQWKRSKPMKEDSQPHILLLAWKGEVFGEAIATITREDIDDGYNFAFVLQKYRRLRSNIPFSKLDLGARGENARDLIKLTPDIIEAYERASGLSILKARLESEEAVEQESDVELELEQVLNPERTRKGQGYALNAKERKCIELRGMKLAESYLKEEGYDVRDVSRSHSYDFVAKKCGKSLFVEVKATVGKGREFLITKSEVQVHIKRHPQNMLIVVSGVKLDHSREHPKASGGDVRVFHPWKLDEERLKPTAFSYRL